jgi:uncharacterized protein YaeQ
VALRPTIYKFAIALNDIDRSHYDSADLTVACHPSETTERMLARVLAWCLNAREGLEFGRGLSEADEPDLRAVGLTGETELWIDVGEPSIERTKKACRVAREVRVYCFNHRADVWWRQSQKALEALRAGVYRFDLTGITALATNLERTLSMSVTISDATIWVDLDTQRCEIRVDELKRVEARG